MVLQRACMGSHLLEGYRRIFKTSDASWNTRKAVTNNTRQMVHQSDIAKNQTIMYLGNNKNVPWRRLIENFQQILRLPRNLSHQRSCRNISQILIMLCMWQQSLIYFTCLGCGVEWLDGSLSMDLQCFCQKEWEDTAKSRCAMLINWYPNWQRWNKIKND